MDTRCAFLGTARRANHGFGLIKIRAPWPGCGFKELLRFDVGMSEGRGLQLSPFPSWECLNVMGGNLYPGMF